MFAITRRSRAIIALGVLMIGFVFATGTAAAAPRDNVNPRLERAYKAQQERLRRQDYHLKRADEFAARMDEFIANQQAKGRDTAALEQAVVNFRAGMADARAFWNEASAVLTAHAGFDDAGRVTNVEQARATLRTAHGHLVDASLAGREAALELRKAIRAYRQANPAPEMPQVPAAP
jgi:hypothetical protein